MIQGDTWISLGITILITTVMYFKGLLGDYLFAVTERCRGRYDEQREMAGIPIVHTEARGRASFDRQTTRRPLRHV